MIILFDKKSDFKEKYNIMAFPLANTKVSFLAKSFILVTQHSVARHHARFFQKV